MRLSAQKMVATLVLRSTRNYPLADAEFFEPIEAIVSLAVMVAVEHGKVPTEKVFLFATHPLPPMNEALFEKRNRQLKHVAERIQKFREQADRIPVVLPGDFNLTPWSP